jgi:DoxX-like protein
VLAGLQAAGLAVTQISPKYGEEHLDHLGVPPAVRPVLPIVKAAAVIGLVIASRRSGLRSIAGAALVSYYSAAVAFHVHSDDPPIDAAPAAVCGLLTATLVSRPPGVRGQSHREPVPRVRRCWAAADTRRSGRTGRDAGVTA